MRGQTLAGLGFHGESIKSQLTELKRRTPFPREVISAAESIRLDEDLFQGRRTVKGPRVDPAGCNDRDDAYDVIGLPNGREVLETHIADVTSVVKWGDIIAESAYRKGATQYFDKGNDPALPRVLSEGLLSLDGEDRKLTLTIATTLSPTLDPESVVMEKTALSGGMNFTYSQVDAILQDETHELYPFFTKSYKLAEGLLHKRQTEGGFAYFDLKSGIAITEEGTIIILDPTRRSGARLIIQEFMFQAGRSMARFFLDNDIPGLFRNQKPNGNAPNIEAAIKELNRISESPSALEVKLLRLRTTTPRAYYSPYPEGHFTLGIEPPDAHSHGTSPLRRVADMVNHWQFTAFQMGWPMLTEGQLVEIGRHLTQITNHRRDKENRILKLTRYLKAEEALEADSPERLVNGDFSRLIKLVAKDGRMTPKVEKEMIERIRKGKLKEYDLFIMLLEDKAEPKTWVRIQREILDYLKDNENRASYIYNTAAGVFGWPKIDYSLKKLNFKGNPIKHLNGIRYRAYGEITLDNKTYKSEILVKDLRKKLRHSVAYDILSQIVENEIASIENDQTYRSRLNWPSLASAPISALSKMSLISSLMR